jgi:hypothetical protein
MNLKIYHNSKNYFIGISHIATDYRTADWLGISSEEYRNILAQYGAQPGDIIDDHYFQNFIEAEKALIHLESYHIMKELTEE